MMRHLYGAALAVLFAAAVFFGASWGYLRLARATAALPAGGTSLLHDTTLLEGGGALLAVALAAGLLLAIPRVSPLAAGLPALAMLAWTGLYLARTGTALRYIPLTGHEFGDGFTALLRGGLLGAAGLVMVVPVFVPSRWRSRPAGYLAGEMPGLVAEDTSLLGPRPGAQPGPATGPLTGGPATGPLTGGPGTGPMARPATGPLTGPGVTRAGASRDTGPAPATTLLGDLPQRGETMTLRDRPSGQQGPEDPAPVTEAIDWTDTQVQPPAPGAVPGKPKPPWENA